MNSTPSRKKKKMREDKGRKGVDVKRCWMRRGSRSSEGAVGSPRPAAAAGSWTRANRLGQQGALICHQQFLHVWPAYPAWGLVPGRVCSPSRHCQKMMCHYKKKKKNWKPRKGSLHAACTNLLLPWFLPKQYPQHLAAILIVHFFQIPIRHIRY